LGRRKERRRPSLALVKSVANEALTISVLHLRRRVLYSAAASASAVAERV
jgi:hypothetical protein